MGPVEFVPLGDGTLAIAAPWFEDEHLVIEGIVAGDMTLASTGVVLARGEAVMVLRDMGHFTRHQEWLTRQDRAAQDSGDDARHDPNLRK